MDKTMTSIEAVAASKMPPYLYHGTCASNHVSIMKHGIKPRGRRRDFSSRHDCVYLTDAFAVKFAADAMKKKGGSLAIYEVDTDMLALHDLAPDDDVLAHQLGRDKKLGQQAAIRLAQKKLRDYASVVNAVASLKASGSCAYFGTIPRICIRRVAFIEWNKQQQFVIGAADVGTGPVAYRFTKDKHRKNMEWLFDAVVPALPDGIDPLIADHFFGVPKTRDGISVEFI